MRKGKNGAGTLFIRSDRNEKFINQFNAAAACQMLALNLATQGYLTTTYMCSENKKFECCVHLENKPIPIVTKAYCYTWKEITSSMYFSNYSKTINRVRCITYYFEY